MPYGGGTFTVTLGTTQDDVTHVDYLPMRADLQSVTGDGSNLTFSFTGDGTVDVHVKTPGTDIISVLAVGRRDRRGSGVRNAGRRRPEFGFRRRRAGDLLDLAAGRTGPAYCHDYGRPDCRQRRDIRFRAPTVAITGTAAGQATTDPATIARSPRSRSRIRISARPRR